MFWSAALQDACPPAPLAAPAPCGRRAEFHAHGYWAPKDSEVQVQDDGAGKRKRRDVLVGGD